MSQKQDLLFCKIAIANGRVTEDQAKKCLAIANKRELETGRRPTIGSVFSKYNLMRKPEVAAVYEAIAKRTGMAVPVAGAPAANSGRVGAAARAGGKGRKGSFSDDSRQRRVDPNALALGVAFGVIFIGIIVTLLIMFLTHGPEGPGEGDDPTVAGTEAGASATGEPAGAGAAAGTTAAGTPGTAAGGTAGGTPGTAPVTPTVMRDDHRRTIRQRLTDARHASLTDTAKALGMLKTLKSTIVDKKIFVDPGLMTELDSEIKHLETGDDGGDAPGDDDSGLDDDL